MVITAARGDQSQAGSEFAEAAPFPLVLLRMVDLDPGQASRRQVANHLVRDLPASRLTARVGQSRDAPGCIDQPDRFRRVECVAGHLSRAPGPKPIWAESLVETRHDAGVDHRTGDVRTADHSSAGDLADLLPRHWSPELIQLVDHGARPVQTALPDLGHLAG